MYIYIFQGEVMTGLYVTAFVLAAAARSVMYVVTVEIYPTFMRNSLLGFTTTLGRIAAISTPFLMREVVYKESNQRQY